MYRTAVRGDMRISQGMDAIPCIFGSKTTARRQRTRSWRAMRRRRKAPGSGGPARGPAAARREGGLGERKRRPAGRTGHPCTVAVVLRRSRGMGAREMPTAPGPATARSTSLCPRRCQGRLCPPLPAVSRPPDQRWKELERRLDNYHVFGPIKQSRGLAIECRSSYCLSWVVSRVGYLPNWGFFRFQGVAGGQESWAGLPSLCDRHRAPMARSCHQNVAT